MFELICHVASVVIVTQTVTFSKWFPVKKYVFIL